MCLMQDQPLGSWQVKRQVGSSTPIAYKFPPKFTLKAGGSVTVTFVCKPITSSLGLFLCVRSSLTVPGWVHDPSDLWPLQIWAASGGGSHNPPTDLLWKTQNSWGTGDLLQTSLISANGEVWPHFTSITHVCSFNCSNSLPYLTTRKWPWGKWPAPSSVKMRKMTTW